MKVVVDYEGFQLGKSVTIKELAICSVDSTSSHHFFFLPPFPLKKIDPQHRSSVKYCEKKIHHIRWNSGHIPYSNLVPILKSHVKSNDIIYVKGENKRQVLSQLLPGFVIINIEIQGCPKVDEIKHKSEFKGQCILPQHQETLHCALLKSRIFPSWIKSHAE